VPRLIVDAQLDRRAAEALMLEIRMLAAACGLETEQALVQLLPHSGQRVTRAKSAAAEKTPGRVSRSRTT
jgi:hypothetical protein